MYAVRRENVTSSNVQKYKRQALAKKYVPESRKFATKVRDVAWLKSEVTQISGWKYGPVGRRVGTPSYNGMVFRLDGSKLVKITLTSPRMFTSEVNGMTKAHQNGNPIKLHFSSSFTLSEVYEPKLKRLFRAYKGDGDAFIGVLVMDDFFAGEGVTDKGDLNDFSRKYPQYKQQVLGELHRLMKQIKVKHGDLHPGNILYRVKSNNVELGIIDFGYSYSGNLGNVTFTNQFGRPTYVNKNHPTVHRVTNNWYLDHWYRKN